MAGGGFLEGFAQSVSALPNVLMHRQQLERQDQQLELQKRAQQQQENIESRKGIAKALETYDNIVNYVPDNLKPSAIKAWIASVEQQSGQKMSPEIKTALAKGDPDFSTALAQAFVENPDINASNLGQALNNEALVGMLVSHGKKQAEQQQAQALQQVGQQALTGDQPDQTMVVPTSERAVPNEGRTLTPITTKEVTIPGQKGEPATPQNTSGLQAKKARLESLLARPDLPKEMRQSYEKILEQTNAQLNTSVDDKSQMLTIARELQLDPSIPVHQAIISQELLNRKTQASTAEEQGKQLAQPVPLEVARATGVSPLMNRAEARSLPGAATARVMSETELTAANERAKQNEQPVDLGTARATGVSPFANRGEVRSNPNAANVQVLSEAQLEGAKETAKQNAQPVDLGLARETGINPLQSRGEARQNFGAEGLTLPTDADKTAANEDVKGTAEVFKEYGKGGREAVSRMQARQQLRALLPYVTTGMAAAQRQQLDRLASMVGIKTEGLAATQAFDMLSKHMALATRRDMPGAMSDADREFQVNSEANISREKNANYIKLAFDDIIDQRLQERAAAIPKYQRTCGLRGQYCEGKSFDEIWSEFTAKNPLQPKFQAVLQKYGGKAAAAGKPAQGTAQRGGASGDWEDTPAGKPGKPSAANPPPMTEEQMAEIEGNSGYADRVKRQILNSFKF